MYKSLIVMLFLMLMGCGESFTPHSVYQVGKLCAILERDNTPRVEDGLQVIKTKRSACGNAFAISPTRIISAAHIFEQDGRLVVGEIYIDGHLLNVRDADKFGEDGIYIDVDRIPDGMPILRVSTRRARGDDISMPTRHGDGSIVRGRLLAANSVTFLAKQGMSGSPIISDSGEVIGVLSYVIPELGVSVFTSFENLK